MEGPGNTGAFRHPAAHWLDRIPSGRVVACQRVEPSIGRQFLKIIMIAVSQI
jgi:hypothetical protein